MKKNLLVVFILLVGILFFGSQAGATTIGYELLPVYGDGDGDPYVGTGQDQDTFDAVNALIEGFNDKIGSSLSLILNDFIYEDDSFDGNDLTFTVDISEGVDYISFKYDSRFDLFYVADLFTFTWHWDDNKYGLSHYTEWSTAAPVPEPATMLLLGTGLLSFGAVSRRKFIKK